MRKALWLVGLMAVYFFVALSVTASIQGRIDGVVLDKAGKPLSDVRVMITALKSAAIHFEVKTDQDGKFTQIGIQPDYYRVEFKREGYLTQSQEVRVRIQEATKLAITLEKAEEAVTKTLSEADGQFFKGNRFFAENKYKEAAAAFESAISLNPRQWSYYLNLGLAYKKLDDKEKAKEAFSKARELNPDSYSTNKELAESLAKEGDFEEAKVYYRRATEISPDDPDAFYNLGACLLNTGDTEAAQQAFLKTIELKNDYADAYFQLGTLYIGQNKVQEATESLEKFLQLAPDHEKAGLARQLLDYLKK